MPFNGILDSVYLDHNHQQVAALLWPAGFPDMVQLMCTSGENWLTTLVLTWYHFLQNQCTVLFKHTLILYIFALLFSRNE